MPRPLRRELPEGYFHVTARAVQETMLFRDDADRRLFVTLLRHAVRRFDVSLHAFCLMGTHYHALVDAATEPLSLAVQWLQGIYAREFNARHDRRGALFAERFSSWVIRDEHHLAAAIEYILANPVRAGLVRGIEDWEWSGWGRAERPTHQRPRDRAGWTPTPNPLRCSVSTTSCVRSSAACRPVPTRTALPASWPSSLTRLPTRKSSR
jgi:REP element-mobilizing transposase RayT